MVDSGRVPERFLLGKAFQEDMPLNMYVYPVVTGATLPDVFTKFAVVAPSLDCIVVTPVAAHMVFDRSFVLGPAEHVTLEVAGDEPGILSADGRESLELPVGARVSVGAAPEPARLVRRSDAQSFYSRVRDKFDLPGDRTS